MPVKNLIPEIQEKYIPLFWEKVDVRSPEECWPWKADLRRGGYGRFAVNRISFPATRVMFVMEYGADPFPYLILHRCDNPTCVNPDHLFVGTNQDNMDDCVAKKRKKSGDAHWSRSKPELLARGDAHGSRTHPESRKRGESHGMAKLNSAAIRQIRTLAMTEKRIHIAQRFGVSATTICDILKGRIWRHV